MLGTQEPGSHVREASEDNAALKEEVVEEEDNRETTDYLVKVMSKILSGAVAEVGEGDIVSFIQFLDRVGEDGNDVSAYPSVEDYGTVTKDHETM